MFKPKNTVPTEEPVVAKPKHKKPAREAKMFQPSTFASRKAEAGEVKQDRRLVSLGKSDFNQRNQKTGVIESFEVELFMDLDHPTDRWAAFPNHPGLVPLHDNGNGRDEVTRYTGTLRKPAGSEWPDALPESTRPV